MTAPEPALRLPRMRVVNTSGISDRTRVFIDGLDVSACFRDATIRIKPNHTVEADLTAIAVELELDGVESLQFTDEQTRELLIKHGWTPPLAEDT